MCFQSIRINRCLQTCSIFHYGDHLLFTHLLLFWSHLSIVEKSSKSAHLYCSYIYYISRYTLYAREIIDYIPDIGYVTNTLPPLYNITILEKLLICRGDWLRRLEQVLFILFICLCNHFVIVPTTVTDRNVFFVVILNYYFCLMIFNKTK